MYNTISRQLLFLAIAFFLSYSSNAQISYGGSPLSWENSKIEWDIPVHSMHSFDVEAMKAEDVIANEFKDVPYRFGKNFYLGKNLSNSGTWHDLPNGDRVWLIELHSQGAFTLNLTFDMFDLPEGANMYVYTPDFENVIGKFDSRNNNDEQIFSTWPLPGDRIVIEYYEPAEVIGQGIIQIESVTHAYRDLEKIARGIGDSGTCNNDIICPVSAGWENEINGVAMIVVGSNGICTGSLINNSANDGHPYFLTANHCTGGGVTGWVFRFNFQATTCGGATSQTYNTVTGSSMLSQASPSDYALLEINNGNPVPTAYNPYYSGWNATGVNATNACGIHHPSGDLKKISFENQATETTNYGGSAGSGTDHVRVVDWDDGTTEPGSSGSPLFDQNHRIIGQLHGGGAACGNNSSDWYGAFAYTYPSICQWLDPSCTAGVLDGYDPNTPTANLDAQLNSVIAPTGTYCSAQINPQVVLRNAGTTTLTSVTINYDVDGGTNQTYSWTGSLASGSTTTISLSAMTVAGGNHTFNASTSNPNGGTDENTANDASSSSFNTVVGGLGVDLTLTTDCWGSEVTWEIQDGGGTVLFSGGPYVNVTGGTTETASFCLPTGCYDFVINDSYGDGMYGTQWGCSVNGDYNVTDEFGNVLVQMTAVNSDYGTGTSHNFCVTAGTPGCMDNAACNYDAAATTDDGSCTFPGCTDNTACNYNASAGCDDGSCILPDGCTDNSACNYNASAQCDDGTCDYVSCVGCTDNSACNFDSTATQDDGSCTFPGCTDNTACNFNASAGCEDGSCILPDGCTDNSACNYNASALCDDGTCDFVSCVGCTDNSACNFDSTATQDDGSCTFPGCTDNTACNYNASAGCDDGSCILPDGCTDNTACNYNASSLCDDGTCDYVSCVGCTDNTACNFDSTASQDDGSCILPDGCTDNTACNYNVSAQCDDGTCDYSCYGCTDSTACNFDSMASMDDSSCEFTSCVCMGDLNGDGFVNVVDLLSFLANFGCTGNCIGDLNNDNSVNAADLLTFLSVYGSTCP